jgi:hypothetical protein
VRFERDEKAALRPLPSLLLPVREQRLRRRLRLGYVAEREAVIAAHDVGGRCHAAVEAPAGRSGGGCSSGDDGASSSDRGGERCRQSSPTSVASRRRTTCGDPRNRAWQ